MNMKIFFFENDSLNQAIKGRVVGTLINLRRLISRTN